jgi:hypothetical protein
MVTMFDWFKDQLINAPDDKIEGLITMIKALHLRDGLADSDYKTLERHWLIRLEWIARKGVGK